ncbi:MAG: hypothetical protein SFV15_22860 [Polyangiaceae bacterium]|nr:hypothetical protein [Polyangiaceae bacterium]
MATIPNEPSHSGASLKPAALSIAPQSPVGPLKSAKVRTALVLVALLLGGVGLKASVLDQQGPASAAEFPLPTLELPESAPDVSLHALAGSWLVSSCAPATGDPTSTELSVEGGQVTEVRRTFQAAGCLTELYTITLKKSINRLTTSANSHVEAEYSLNEATLNVRNAALLNQRSFLGQSDWKDGETRDLMGPLSGKLFGTPLKTGATTYDLLHIDGQQLLARAAGLVSLSLPTSVAPIAFARTN